MAKIMVGDEKTVDEMDMMHDLGCPKSPVILQSARTLTMNLAKSSFVLSY